MLFSKKYEKKHNNLLHEAMTAAAAYRFTELKAES